MELSEFNPELNATLLRTMQKICHQNDKAAAFLIRNFYTILKRIVS